MPPNKKPECVILAGPNGAGKSTLHRILELPGIFVNADDVARELDPSNPEAQSIAAGRLVLNKLDQLIADRNSFVYETTLSSHQSVNLMKKAKQAGYAVALFFVALESAELHIERVAHRVSLGGHHIPAEAIRRRYFTSFANLARALSPADEASLFDNSSPQGMRVVARVSHGKLVEYDYRPIYTIDRLIADCLKDSLAIDLSVATDR